MELEDSRKFVKQLTATDINQNLAVPTEFVSRNGLVDAQELEVIDFGPGNRNRYVFELSIRGTSTFMKPVFRARGWRQFVRQNYLRAGDTIHFWMRDDQQGFGIQVEKDIMARFDHPAKVLIN